MSRSGSRTQKLKRRIRRRLKKIFGNSPMFNIIVFAAVFVAVGFLAKNKIEKSTPDISHLKGTVHTQLAAAPDEEEEDTDGEELKEDEEDKVEERVYVVKEIPKDAYNEDGTIDCYIDGKTNLKKLPDSSVKAVADEVDTNPDSITVLVNKMYPLDESYEADDLEYVDVKFGIWYKDEKKKLRTEAATALETMFKSAEKKGYNLTGVSGYRSYKRQEMIYNNNLVAKGYEHTNKYSARPGRSEHQLGLSIDISCDSAGGNLTETFIDTPEGKWVKENCYRFGFIVRYPKGKEKITGYSYEPWHVRYVGYDLARFLYDNDMTLDEYYGYEANLERIQKEEWKYYAALLGIEDEEPVGEPGSEATVNPGNVDDIVDPAHTDIPHITLPPDADIDVTDEPEETKSGDTTTKPATKKPKTTKPAATKTATKKPETTKPVTKEPAATKTATKKPVTKEPEKTKTPTKKPQTTKPATQEPVTKKPESTKPATKEPETAKPAQTEEAKTEKPKETDNKGNDDINDEG